MADHKDCAHHYTNSPTTPNGNELIRGVEALQERLEQSIAGYEKLSTEHSDLKGISEQQQLRYAELECATRTLRNENNHFAQKIVEFELSQAKLNERLATSIRHQIQTEKKKAETEIELEATRGSLSVMTERSKELSLDLALARAIKKSTQENLEVVHAELNSIQEDSRRFAQAKAGELKEKDQEIIRLCEQVRLETESKDRLLKSFQDSEHAKKTLYQELELSRCQIQWAQEELQKSLKVQESERMRLREQVKALQAQMSLKTDMGTRLETQMQILQLSQTRRKQEQEFMKSSARLVANAVERFSKESTDDTVSGVAQDSSDSILDPREARRVQIARGNQFIKTLETTLSVNRRHPEVAS